MTSRSSSVRDAPQVLVAYEPGDLKRQIEDVVGALGLIPLSADDGDAAATVLVDRKPDLMVVDAGIGGRASFELCDYIREKKLPTRVILVASVYRRTRYKRKPTSLYGADDYVEQHHIHDMLPEKISAALGGRGGWDASRFVDTELTRRFGEGRLEFGSLDGEEAVRQARRLAWIIVSDMALYNPELVRPATGPASARTGADLAEGQRLFDELVPEPVRDTEDFMGGALKRIRESRLSHPEPDKGLK